MRTTTFAFAALLVSTLPSAHAAPSDAVFAIARQFDSHSVIQLGELHRSL